MSYIVDPADLHAIRVELGPQPEEGMGYLVREGGKVRQGVGYASSVDTSFLLPCRAAIVPYHRSKEGVTAGVVTAALRYLVELPAFTVVNSNDKFDVAAAMWQGGQFVGKGAERMPTVPDGNVYAAVEAGTTGDVQPTWNAAGSTADGGVTWRRTRGYLRLQIVEVAAIDPYEITRNVWGDLKT